MPGIRFIQRQHPVGQGGFHTGELFDIKSQGTPAFSWIYDCGSNQMTRLHAEISALSHSAFDLLFLSHLDADHISGVDNLLSSVSVTEVVLPYLNDIDRTFLLATALRAGSATDSFVAFVEDPALWFGERGVERVTYFLGSDDEDGEPDPPDPIEPTPIEWDSKGLEKIRFKWSRQPQLISPTGSAPNAAQVAAIGATAVGVLQAHNATLNWILSPFAVQPPALKMAKFQRALDRAFGPGKTARDYAAEARTDPGRKKLRRCYDRVYSTHNLHSMALYAGPVEKQHSAITNTAFYGVFVRRSVEAGWLSTGDFAANVHVRRNKLFAYYRRFVEFIGQLSLPHHGSDLSFDATLLTYPLNLRAAVAAVGPNSHGHPGFAVQAAVAATGTVAFARVDDTPGLDYRVIGPVT